MYIPYATVCSTVCSELAQDTCLELRGRLNIAVEEREATMQQAQELSDQLGTANKDRERLQQDLISSISSHQLDRLMSCKHGLMN